MELSKSIALRFTPNAGAAHAAREAVTESVAGLAEPKEVVDDVRLLVSELVTNSVRHAPLAGDGWIVVRADFDPERIRVEVANGGHGFEVPDTGPTSGGEGGWGLYLVERIASRWGIDRKGWTRVWFEIDRDPAPGTEVTV